MAVEIERKFLVEDDAWHAAVTGRMRIRQAYLSRNGRASVRIRLIDDNAAMLAIKSADKTGGPALLRSEFEYAVPVDDAMAMLDLRIGLVIDKIRHLIPAGNGRTWEVDVFAGAHEGLVLAEIELESPDETVDLPRWIGREVTGDPRYGNLALAQSEPTGG